MPGLCHGEHGAVCVNARTVASKRAMVRDGSILALQQNDSLKAFDIGVVTLKGDVRLSGMLDSQAQIDEALRIARAADGAHAVHDELTIKK